MFFLLIHYTFYKNHSKYHNPSFGFAQYPPLYILNLSEHLMKVPIFRRYNLFFLTRKSIKNDAQRWLCVVGIL